MKIPDSDISIALPGGETLDCRRIPETGPAGFMMGDRGFTTDEEPRHCVVLSRPYLMSVFPVTQCQMAAWTATRDYEAFRKKEGIKVRHSNAFSGEDKNPAEQVTWAEAAGFCDWLNSLPQTAGTAGKWSASLPTEAQWEYACRGGTQTEFTTGDGQTAIDEAGWTGFLYRDGQTFPVGLKKPNAYGLYDMHGNVWEWCRDAWDENAYRKRSSPAVDPLVESHDPEVKRVLRGGTWCRPAGYARCSYRAGEDPVVRLWSYGFRVCLNK